jgi:hypothetical protein
VSVGAAVVGELDSAHVEGRRIARDVFGIVDEDELGLGSRKRRMSQAQAARSI